MIFGKSQALEHYQPDLNIDISAMLNVYQPQSPLLGTTAHKEGPTDLPGILKVHTVLPTRMTDWKPAQTSTVICFFKIKSKVLAKCLGESFSTL